MEIIYLITGFLLGSFFVYLYFRSNQKRFQDSNLQLEELKASILQKETEISSQLQHIAELRTENNFTEKQSLELKEEVINLKSSVTQKEIDLQQQVKEATFLKAQNEAMSEKLENQKTEFISLKEQMNNEFKVLANQILEEKSKKFVEINEEKISVILNPLKERIQHFEKKVEETYNNETREKASLKKELEFIVNINKQMSEDANKLTRALKGDSKKQGDWGEMQLEMLLEKSGLVKDIHFRSQENFKTEEGLNVRPDYVVNLPEGKSYIIDSKVSLTAYEHYFNTEDDSHREKYLKEHIDSITKHINDLGAKSYQNLYGINSPDFVFLFVPIEPALMVALQNDTTLFEKALARNVVLVSTSMLLATMRTVSFIWKQENQRRNVFEIAKESGALYDKFCGFFDDLVNVGKRLDGAKDEYKAAMNKLTESTRKGDTIIGRMEKIKELGANATKSLPQSVLDRIE